MTNPPINTQNGWVDWLEVGQSALVRGMLLIPLGLIPLSLICSHVVALLEVLAHKQHVDIDIFSSIGVVWIRLICGGVIGLGGGILAWGTNRVLGLSRLPIWAYPALVFMMMALSMLPSIKSGFSADEQRLSFSYLGMRLGVLCSMVIGILLRLRQHLGEARRVRAEADRDALAASFIQSRTAPLVRRRSNSHVYLVCKALCILVVFVYVCSLVVFGWDDPDAQKHPRSSGENDSQAEEVLRIAASVGVKGWGAGRVEAASKQVVTEPLNLTYTADDLRLRA